MGQYKVPQDVEAEDKLVGFLTLKQFIYAVIGTGWLALSFAIFKSVPVFFVVLGIPPGFLFLMLGLYNRQGQPFEALFLALVSYWSKPRKRLWEKEPIEHIFNVEPAPPKIEPITRNQAEVRGQLEKLVHVLESRSGGTKHPELQEQSQENHIDASDRIYMPTHLEEESAPNQQMDITKSDDVLDVENNPNAQNLDQLIEGAVQDIRDKAVKNMHDARSVTSQAKPTVAPTASPSVSGMTASSPDDILKKSLAESPLRVNQIADRAGRPAELKEGEVVKFESPGQQAGPSQQGQH